MFVIKKIASAFLLPPGVFVLLLTVAGLILLVRKKIAGGSFSLVLAATIWALSRLSIQTIRRYLMRRQILTPIGTRSPAVLTPVR